ncbi:unnamed protein product [Euphydryas editha]|uniref:Uncharacterized protein n=1 Tax=Euphydryas editha TaxID=104508 RepID=A0AAU9UPG7_EUPED|nr:unnamed protein product [Euphydryas editha]
MMSSMNTSLEKLSLDNTIIRESLSDIQARVTVLEESASFSSEQFNEWKGRVEVVEKHVPITSSITDQMVVLQHKLDIMEQQARECNIEISNLPERRNENLLTLVEQLGTVIKVPITAAQITSGQRESSQASWPSHPAARLACTQRVSQMVDPSLLNRHNRPVFHDFGNCPIEQDPKPPSQLFQGDAQYSSWNTIRPWCRPPGPQTIQGHVHFPLGNRRDGHLGLVQGRRRHRGRNVARTVWKKLRHYPLEEIRRLYVYPGKVHSLKSFIPYLCRFCLLYWRNTKRPRNGTILSSMHIS